ncbi:MAG: DUF2589 domain-containing protein [Verrucomicrobiota bacterium]
MTPPKEDRSNQSSASMRPLPFSALIGAPLEAGIKAQSQATLATLEQIRSFGFHQHHGTSEPVYLTFQYKQNGKTIRFSVPLITVVPVTFFTLENFAVEFSASISALNTTTDTSSPDPQDPPQTNFLASYSSTDLKSPQPNSRYAPERNIHVRLAAEQADLPSGVASILNILQGCSKQEQVSDSLTMKPQATKLTAEETSSTTFQVYLSDPDDTPIRGQQVTFALSPSSPAVTLSSESVTTDNRGIAEVTASLTGLEITSAEAIKLVATAVLATSSLEASSWITLIPEAPPEPDPGSFSVDPTQLTLASDNVPNTQSTTITLLDTQGSPMPGQSITCSLDKVPEATLKLNVDTAVLQKQISTTTLIAVTDENGIVELSVELEDSSLEQAQTPVLKIHANAQPSIQAQLSVTLLPATPSPEPNTITFDSDLLTLSGDAIPDTQTVSIALLDTDQNPMPEQPILCSLDSVEGTVLQLGVDPERLIEQNSSTELTAQTDSQGTFSLSVTLLGDDLTDTQTLQLTAQSTTASSIESSAEITLTPVTPPPLPSYNIALEPKAFVYEDSSTSQMFQPSATVTDAESGEPQANVQVDFKLLDPPSELSYALAINDGTPTGASSSTYASVLTNEDGVAAINLTISDNPPDGLNDLKTSKFTAVVTETSTEADALFIFKPALEGVILTLIPSIATLDASDPSATASFSVKALTTGLDPIPLQSIQVSLPTITQADMLLSVTGGENASADSPTEVSALTNESGAIEVEVIMTHASFTDYQTAPITATSQATIQDQPQTFTNTGTLQLIPSSSPELSMDLKPGGVYLYFSDSTRPNSIEQTVTVTNSNSGTPQAGLQIDFTVDEIPQGATIQLTQEQGSLVSQPDDTTLSLLTDTDGIAKITLSVQNSGAYQIGSFNLIATCEAENLTKRTPYQLFPPDDNITLDYSAGSLTLDASQNPATKTLRLTAMTTESTPQPAVNLPYNFALDPTTAGDLSMEITQGTSTNDNNPATYVAGTTDALGTLEVTFTLSDPTLTEDQILNLTVNWADSNHTERKNIPVTLEAPTEPEVPEPVLTRLEFTPLFSQIDTSDLPQTRTYTATLKDVQNNPLTNEQVTFNVTSPTGTDFSLSIPADPSADIYSSHAVGTTNANGQIVFEIIVSEYTNYETDYILLNVEADTSSLTANAKLECLVPKVGALFLSPPAGFVNPERPEPVTFEAKAFNQEGKPQAGLLLEFSTNPETNMLEIAYGEQAPVPANEPIEGYTDSDGTLAVSVHYNRALNERPETPQSVSAVIRDPSSGKEISALIIVLPLASSMFTFEPTHLSLRTASNEAVPVTITLNSIPNANIEVDVDFTHSTTADLRVASSTSGPFEHSATLTTDSYGHATAYVKINQTTLTPQTSCLTACEKSTGIGTSYLPVIVNTSEPSSFQFFGVCNLRADDVPDTDDLKIKLVNSENMHVPDRLVHITLTPPEGAVMDLWIDRREEQVRSIPKIHEISGFTDSSGEIDVNLSLKQYVGKAHAYATVTAYLDGSSVIGTANNKVEIHPNESGDPYIGFDRAAIVIAAADSPHVAVTLTTYWFSSADYRDVDVQLSLTGKEDIAFIEPYPSLTTDENGQATLQLLYRSPGKAILTASAVIDGTPTSNTIEVICIDQTPNSQT